MFEHREQIEWSNFWWEDANKRCDRILLIGDSVTRGYRSSLNNILKMQGYVVDLCAFSASVVDSLTEKMLKAFFAVTEYSYDYIGVQMGGQHDWSIKCCEDLEDRNLFKQFYKRYVIELKSKCKVLFLLSYTPTVLKEDLEKDNIERNKELICRNEIAKEVAFETNCQYIDLWSTILEKECKHVDYIHFDREANQYIAICVSDFFRGFV